MLSTMSHPAAPIIGNLLAQDGMKESLSSRFGEIFYDKTNLLTFPHGLLGFPNHARFALAEFPTPGMSQFRILQSLDMHSLSFITLPLQVKNPFIQREDITAALGDLGIAEEHAELLLVISVQRLPSRTRVTANMRAPIFVDSLRQLAAQYVFTNDRYQVQSEIS